MYLLVSFLRLFSSFNCFYFVLFSCPCGHVRKYPKTMFVCIYSEIGSIPDRWYPFNDLLRFSARFSVSNNNDFADSGSHSFYDLRHHYRRSLACMCLCVRAQLRQKARVRSTCRLIAFTPHFPFRFPNDVEHTNVVMSNEKFQPKFVCEYIRLPLYNRNAGRLPTTKFGPNHIERITLKCVETWERESL